MREIGSTWLGPATICCCRISLEPEGQIAYTPTSKKATIISSSVIVLRAAQSVSPERREVDRIWPGNPRIVRAGKCQVTSGIHRKGMGYGIKRGN
jgi:hypothetical protein